MIDPSYGQGILRPLLRGVLEDLGPPASSVLVLLDERARSAVGEPLQQVLELLDIPVVEYVWEAEEGLKTLSQAEEITRHFVRGGADRNSLLVAIGGGVTTDLGGFVASLLMRGIRWGAVPTTLLGMADAAIGGKTATNLPEGKNLVGAFHQPLFVLCDIDTLATLPEKEWSCGLGEVVKTAFLSGDDDWRALEDADPAELRRPSQTLLAAAAAAGATKMRVVREDPHEAGLRKLLNLGHTFGHALETAAGHGTLGHGEAVALGLRCAMRMAEDMEIAEAGIATRLRTLCIKLGLRPSYPGTLPGPAELQSLLLRDKKAVSGKLDLILPVEPGRCLIMRGVDPDAAAAVIHREL